MHASNRIIQGLWVGGSLSQMEQLSIRSFLANGHAYHLYTYGDVQEVPPGTVVKDGNEILPADQIFTHQSGWGQGSYAGFADLFRYQLLRQKGGWWTDTDVICLQPFDFTDDYVIASSREGEWGAPATNCVLKMPAGSELAIYLSERSRQRDRHQLQFGEIGPHLLQTAIADLHLDAYVASPQTFCPITWRAVQQTIAYPAAPLTLERMLQTAKASLRCLVRPHSRPGQVNAQSYGLHLWNEIWRQNGLDKNATYAPTCWYERLKTRYGKFQGY